MNFVFILIYYLILLLYINKNSKKCFAYIVLVLFINILFTKINASYNVTFFDVGQGDSILIKTPFNKNSILIDTGGNVSDYNISSNIITYLNSIGIYKLDYLVLSHGDFDHMGEARYLVENFKVNKVIFNCGPYNNLEKELIKVLNKEEIKYQSCINRLNMGNVSFKFLQTREYDNENDNSNVIYTEFNGYKFMFIGDAGSDKELDMLNKYDISDIDVLKVGHHGSDTSSNKEFIDRMNPKYSIISVGKNNRYGHPNKEVLEILKNSNVYRTDKDGSVMFIIKNNKLKIETYSP